MLDYHIDNYLWLPVDTSIGKRIIGKDETSCRYCKRSSREVELKKESHTIPIAIGNVNLTSADECEECNHYFGETIENCLGNFTLLERAIFGIKGRKGFPTYQSKDKKSKIFVEDNVTNIQCDIDSNFAILNHAEKTLTFRADTPSFSFLNVFKSFVKIAIAISSKDDLPDFHETILWLLGKIPHSITPWQATKVFRWFTPDHSLDHPRAILLKKKHDSALIPNFILVVEYSYYMVVIYIPFVRSDKQLEGKEINIVPFPHRMLGKKNSEVFGTITDMSSDDKNSHATEYTVQIVGDITTGSTPPPPSSLPNPPDGGDGAD
ncbi:MAG TPA: HNH endonuclease [Nitratidesulfovibrio sp.]|nr:HNH endonuclease [Nitratidesulfovibrio sp.]